MVLNMCLSVEVQKELKKIAQRFNAQVSMVVTDYFEAHFRESLRPIHIQCLIGTSFKENTYIQTLPGVWEFTLPT